MKNLFLFPLILVDTLFNLIDYCLYAIIEGLLQLVREK